MKLAWKLIALTLGLGLFAWYLAGIDLKAVWELLRRLGWYTPLVLVPYLLVYVVDCIGWRCCFPPGFKVRFAALFHIRWIGEAVNNILPSAYVGGEAVKVYLLKKRGVDTKIGTSSAVVSKTAQSAAQLIFILLGSLVFLNLGREQPGLRRGMLLVLIGGSVVLAGLFWLQNRGLFASLLKVVDALPFKLAALQKRRAHLLEVDDSVTDFYRHHRARFFASMGFYMCGWLMDTLEILLVSHLLGMPITWPQALAVEAFTSVAKILGMWVPGSLGVQESGIVMLGRFAGLPDNLSVAYALIRRARELFFALVGWLLFSSSRVDLKGLKADAAKQ